MLHAVTCLFISGCASCDFWSVSVNYMSPPLNIKPNQRLIIDAIAFYASVPLVVEASGEELFLHQDLLEVSLSSHDSCPVLFGFRVVDRRKSVKERKAAEDCIISGSYGHSEECKCLRKPQLSAGCRHKDTQVTRSICNDCCGVVGEVVEGGFPQFFLELARQLFRPLMEVPVCSGSHTYHSSNA